MNPATTTSKVVELFPTSNHGCLQIHWHAGEYMKFSSNQRKGLNTNKSLHFTPPPCCCCLWGNISGKLTQQNANHSKITPRNKEMHSSVGHIHSQQQATWWGNDINFILRNFKWKILWGTFSFKWISWGDNWCVLPWHTTTEAEEHTFDFRPYGTIVFFSILILININTICSIKLFDVP